MTAALDLTTPILRFRPTRREHCLNDESTKEVVYFFGEVLCPGCEYPVLVSASLEDGPERGYCPRPGCATEIVVAVEIDLHLRLDDSRPMRWLERGCVCGEPLCRGWEAV